MKKDHPQPTTSTVKKLYARAFKCAYPECNEGLYKEDLVSGTWLLNSRVCHICARSEDGPRWDPSQSSEANRADENLILMCIPHASIIDDFQSIDSYPVSTLSLWKNNQIEKHKNLISGWQITERMAESAIQASFPNVAVAISNSTVSLGGEGGKAPGAGGGGGGAIGPNARGGKGGSGGKVLDADGNNIESEVIDDIFKEHPLDFSPGAGGGGSPGIGPNSLGGDGGNGGDCVIDKMYLEAGDIVECVVGKGGNAPKMPGLHGSPGEDSIITVKSPDGAIKKVLRASGGESAKSGNLPDEWKPISIQDIENGFQISSLFVARVIDFYQETFSILNGGYCYSKNQHIPFDLILNVLCVASWEKLEQGEMRGLQLCMIRPDGVEVSRIAMCIPEGTFLSYMWPLQIGAPIDQEGIWKLRVISGKFLLSEIYITITIPKDV